MDLALQKAEEVFKHNSDAIVLGFDTLVILDGNPLGKPKDYDDAFRMLRSLSGREHQVLTGCAIVLDEKKELFYDYA